MQSEAIQNQPTQLTSIIQYILQQIKTKGVKYHQQDAFIEKELINKLQTCELTSEKLLPSIEKLIDSNKLQSPNKYIVLMYTSLLGVGNNHSLALFSFYYKLASHALKEIKQSKTKNQQSWHFFFQKLYQYGMLLLTGNRTMLLSMQSLGMRVNSQLFANKARQMKLNKLVRIYNCILCIPQPYMSLKQTLSLTLVFTRWSMSQNDAFTHSFFAAFQKKTQKKLIKKLSKYPKQQFIEQHILNLIKIVMCGQQMLFSYFLQAKVAYQCSTNQNIMGRQKFALQGLKGAILLKEGKRLFNLVIKLLLQARDGPLNNIRREAILVITLRFISSKFQNNEGLFNILIDNFLYQKNQIISQIAFRIIREEALNYLTVYKVKLLLNLFNISSWGILVKDGIAEELVIDRLGRINLLLMGLAYRYSNSNINIKCSSQKYGLIIQNARDVKSLTFVIVFQDVGKLAQPQDLNGSLLKLKLDGAIYQLKISFAEVSGSLSIQYKPQQKQRQGKVKIFSGQKQILNEAKQFIRYKDGSYISLVTASLGGKEGRKLNLSVDGSYYEFDLSKKSEIKGIQLGRIRGTIQSFYALNIQISPVEFYKQWSEYQKKTNYVIQRLGKDKICYKLTNRLQTPIQVAVDKGWSLFKAKTQIYIKGAIKSPILMDIFLQLGGLETMFFILQRLSRTLLQFKGKEEKIVQLLGQFFEMIKLTASLDESYSFIIQIIKCFKYINPFMFLLIKRNKFFKQTHDSRLLQSIFQMIVYFRKEKALSITPSQITKKMKGIQIKFLVQTLCNFQIWSGCSFPLQLFVLSLIENFIKNENCVKQLIQVDLYKQILGTLVLFATSQTHLSNSLSLQSKLIQICDYLYLQIQGDFTSLQQIKQIQLSKDKQIYDNFIERDMFMSLSLLKALSSKGFSRKLSESQKSAFISILKHLTKNFIQTSYFKIIAKNWSLYLQFLFGISQKMIWIDRELLNALADTVMIFVSRQLTIDGCITIFFRSCINNKGTTFIDCLHLLLSISQKYSFISPGKSLIFERVVQYLQQKMVQISKKEAIQIVKQLQIFSKFVPIDGLFRLSKKKQFFQLLQNIKEIYFHFSQTRPFWRSYNYNLIILLCQHNKITQKNANFIKYLLQNIYLEHPDHPLALNKHYKTSEKVFELKELAKSQKKHENQMKINMKGVYSLIDHCRGWLTLYFLHEHALLNGSNDLCIPFLASQITKQNPPGGIIPYYLSGKCELHELYFLLNIIVYRQLGNRISYLTTLVPVVIYQQAVEKLIQEISKPTNQLSIVMVIILLKEVHNSLNNGYIIKTGTVHKDLERLLGSIHQDGYRKKQAETADALARASTRIQLALQESKMDKQLAFLLDLQLNVIKKIQQNQDQQISRKMLKLLVQQIKRIHESVFKRLKMVGLRFFQVSKEHWLYNKQPLEQLEPKSQKMTEIVLADNTTFQKLLEQNYQKLLLEYNEKGIESQKNWQNLLISNTYWFQHQGDLSDLSTKFYQLDQKEIGPYGFYKLGIKPARTDLQKLPFPRRQQYKDLIVKKEQQRKLRDIAPRQTILNSKSTYFTQFSRAESITVSISTESMIDKQKKLNNEYWCQWVTKRGVYAGKLCKRDKKLEFTFTGHTKLPADREYQMSTNKCHWIEQPSEWQLKEFGNAEIPYLGSEIFTRRYILRHTAFQLFNPNTHKSYFFNLFFQKHLQSFLSQFKSGEVELIINRADAFNKRGFTDKWIKGELSNFEYLCLVNRYSGRTTNDLVQYPVFPWVIINFNGKDGFTQINQKFINQPNNMRDLTKPAGKLGQQKFKKLKSRLEQIDPVDKEIRFLYGTMYSNPTVLYNFFIRLEPYTSLHWEHQSGKLDHADRLFSGIYEQFITVLTSSSDMKELCPQFYYWPQFLRNRNRIQLGRKQKGDEVDAVVLPVWAKNPQEFIFKMREVLESPQVTRYLHHWIDLIFGQKAPYEKAEEHDNLYHFQCYQQDIFTAYESQAEMRTAQIAISEFGQVPQQIFDKPHPSRIPRKEIYLDTVITISKSQLIKGYQYNEVGIMFYTSNEVIFKKAAINGFYNNFQWTREYECQAKSLYLDSIYNNRWIALLQGGVRLHERKKIKAQFEIQSKFLECMGDYLFFGVGSKITIVKAVNESFVEMTQLYGHHSQVILIRTEPTLDLVLSLDRSGLVLVHQLVQLRFLRAFHLGTEFDRQQSRKLRCCIHRMGYFIFFDHEQTLYIYNYLGEQLLEQQMLIKTQERTQAIEKQDTNSEQIITDIQLFSHDAPIILTSTSRGNIYAFNFLQIMRFKEIYPHKNYGREIKNLLSAVTKRKNNSIRQFSMVRSLGTTNTIYQIIVLYDDGQLACFSENVQMTKQLSSNIRLKTMGIV